MIRELEGYLWGIEGNYQEVEQKRGYLICLIKTSHEKLLDDMCILEEFELEFRTIILTQERTHTKPDRLTPIEGLEVTAGCKPRLLSLQVGSEIKDRDRRVRIIVRSVSEDQKVTIIYSPIGDSP